MPRQKAITVENTFNKGLITDAIGIKFPESACTDADNVIFSPTGLVSRREGFDFEDQYSTASINTSGNVIVAYRWDSVAGDGDITFVVTQVGDTLRFYRVAADDALSAGLHATTIDLTTYFTTGTTTVRTLECQFSSGNGLLFVTNRHLESFYVEYDATANTLTATQITIQVRDFEGDTSDNETSITSRTTTNLAGLNAHHRYNLENQGWTSTTLTSWDTARADMPSNADVPQFYKSTTNTFDFSLVANYNIGNSHAPNGHFIYSLYNFNRSTNVSGALDSSITQERVSTSAFFAGRVFYSGLRSPLKASQIYFTQIIEAKAQYGYCYQSEDPTAETLFDLLPTDGGVIDIIDCGVILKMIPMQNQLIVFATNGVWVITGSQGQGFIANDYSVHKLDSIRSISHTSFVVADGAPYWWNNEGIYTIKTDPTTHALQVTSITDYIIREFVQDVPTLNKPYVRGAYDPFYKVIHWIYRSTDINIFDDNYIYDKQMTLNILTQAYSPWSVAVDDVKVNAIVNIYGLGGSFSQVNVMSGADTVISGSDTVIAFTTAQGGAASTIKYLVNYTLASTSTMTFAETRDTDYVDWYSFDSAGVDFTSYAITGYKLRGEGMRKFQVNYIRVYTENDVATSVDVQSLWDFSTSGNTGRWSNVQRIVTDPLSVGLYSNRSKRLKLRGHGLEMQLKFSSVSGEPFHIIGWSTYDSANSGI